MSENPMKCPECDELIDRPLGMLFYARSNLKPGDEMYIYRCPKCNRYRDITHKIKESLALEKAYKSTVARRSPTVEKSQIATSV